MKKLLLVLFACCFLTAVFSQKYYVVSLKGQVFADGKPLKKKAKITSETLVRFGSKDAVAYVMSPGKGYFFLSPNATQRSSKDDFTAYVKNALMPPKQYFLTGTKATIPKELKFWTMKEVGQYFTGDLLLVNKATFAVNNQNIPLDGQHYFSIQFKNKNGETVGKKLNQDFRQFSFDASYFSDSKNPQTIEVALIYHDETAGKTTESGRFNLYLIPEKDLCKELKSIRKEVPDEADEAFYVNHAKLYLDALYGKHDPAEIQPLITRL